jgi:hypothetical protein
VRLGPFFFLAGRASEVADGTPIDEIAGRIGRTRSAIRSRAYVLRLKFSRANAGMIYGSPNRCLARHCEDFIARRLMVHRRRTFEVRSY